MAKGKKPKGATPWLAVISDPHIGNHRAFGGPEENGINRRCRLTLDALSAAVLKAAELGCRALFVAGDLFHTRRPEPAVTAAVQRVFDKAKEAPQPMEIVVVPGNHDMLDAGAEGGNTACAPLWQSAHVVRGVEAFVPLQEDLLAVLVPYTARVSMAQHLVEVLAKHPQPAPGVTGVLVTHVGVWDEADAKAAPWMRRAKDGISAPMLFDLMEKARIRYAFVGNYHNHWVWERDGMTIVQVGTLCPGSFGDEGLVDRGLMATLGPDGWAKHEIPGPRFVVAPEPIPPVLGLVPDPKRLFLRPVRWNVPEEVEARLGGVDWTAVTDVEDESDEGDAAPGPRAETPLESIGQYVEGMKLADGVERGAVHELVLDCWKKGA